MMRHRRDSIWVFHSELTKIFGSSRGCPFQVEPGKPGPVSIFRIERHIFRVAVTPVEKKVAFRVIASKNTMIRNVSSTGGSGGRGCNRRGYRGRSTRPLSEVLSEIQSEARRGRLVDRWQAADNIAGPAPSVAEDMEASIPGSLQNELLDMFGPDEPNNEPARDGPVDGSGDLQSQDLIPQQNQGQAQNPDQEQDLELEELLVDAAVRAVSFFVLISRIHSLYTGLVWLGSWSCNRDNL